MKVEEVRELMDKNLITQVLDPVDVVNNMETPSTGGCDCTDYVLPTATETTLGGVKVGDGLDIDADGKLHTIGGSSDYELPIASYNTLGGVKIGTGLDMDLKTSRGAGLTIDSDGLVGVLYGNGLDVDSKGRLGVKLGSDGLGLDANGKLGVWIGNGLYKGNEGELIVKLGSGLCYNNEYPGIRVKTGYGLGLTADGSLYVDSNGLNYTLPIASKETLGGVKVGDGLTIDDNGSLHTTMAGSVYNPNVKLGGVKVGTSVGSRCPYAKIGINSTTGEIGLNYGAGLKTNSSMGSPSHSALEINYGDGLDIDSDGKLKVKVGTGLEMIDGSLCTTGGGGGSNYTLPKATKTTLGGIIVGTGLTIDTDGELGLSYASRSTSGLVKIGDGLYMKDGNWISVNHGDGLKTNSSMGSPSHSALEINYGDGLDIDSDGKLKVKVGTGLEITNTNLCAQVATSNKFGVIKVGTGLEMIDGSLCTTGGGGGSNYTLPKASTSSLGGVKVGNGLSTDANGKLSINAGVGLSAYGEKLNINIGTGIEINNNEICVKYGVGVKFNDAKQLVADIDYIYQQILTKLQNDGYIQ